MLLIMLSLVLLAACERDDPMQRALRRVANGNLARKANVRSMTVCAGLSRRRYHDNDAAVVSAAIFAALSCRFCSRPPNPWTRSPIFNAGYGLFHSFPAHAA
jgi:hypothetical protein